MEQFPAKRERRRRRRERNHHVLAIILPLAIVAAGIFLYVQWRTGRETPDVVWTAGLALFVSLLGYAFLHPASQKAVSRWEENRMDDRERRFWREREAREKTQRIEQERIDLERRTSENPMLRPPDKPA
jgi:hypothetical protein